MVVVVVMVVVVAAVVVVVVVVEEEGNYHHTSYYIHLGPKWRWGDGIINGGGGLIELAPPELEALPPRGG